MWRQEGGWLDWSKGAPVSLLPLLVIGMRCHCEKVRCRQLRSCFVPDGRLLLRLAVRASRRYS
ncbi:unnamed protein product [Ceutorhynchus assimilis]|uniref:Uncharacterized protein n=1 Tax=Ceutorhynchus assimilis TaxID=467358 RepID=A0A9N9MI72_9CUCU|nr:unnamed protein product [Ceutorhynchus assimilis]